MIGWNGVRVLARQAANDRAMDGWDKTTVTKRRNERKESVWSARKRAVNIEGSGGVEWLDKI